MIYFNISIRNPFWNRFETIKHWSCKEPRNHKSWEIQVTKDDDLFCIEFDWSIRQDHAGIGLELGLLGYKINFSWCDTRHWYVEKGRWMDYSNPQDMEEVYGKNWNKHK